jgi:chromosome segregation ATPase
MTVPDLDAIAAREQIGKLSRLLTIREDQLQTAKDERRRAERDRDAARARVAELEKSAEVNAAFYRVTVQERDRERRIVDHLRAELNEARADRDHLQEKVDYLEEERA